MDMVHEAHTKAELALAAISKHEEHCGERWEEARDALRSLEHAVKSIRSHAWTIAISLIGSLVTLSGALVWKIITVAP